MYDIHEHATYLASARERARNGVNPLLHSLSEARELVLGIISETGVKSVCEVGSEGGLLTAALHDLYIAGSIDKLTIIEPFPTSTVRAYHDGDRCVVVEKPSLDALPECGQHDLFIFDGDHNYHTVKGELETVFDTSSPLVILHDVCWPAAERDQYYAPSRIPPEALRPHTYDGGVVPGNDGIVELGFSSDGSFAWATELGGDANGVFAAIRDVVVARDLKFDSIPALFGIGFVRSRDFRSEERLSKYLPSPATRAFLARLEENRLENYLARINLEGRLHRAEVDVEDLRYGRVGINVLLRAILRKLKRKALRR